MVNGTWWLASLPAAARFSDALGKVERTQTALLMANLRRNAGTEYGRRHGFARIASVREFQERVPLVSYDDLQPMVQRMAAGEADVLIPGRPTAFIPTSGSTAATKLIPYNRALRYEFQEGIATWIAGMFHTYPWIVGGHAFWSVSPVTRRNHRTPGGIAVGYDDDAEYLHPVIARLLARAMAVPSSVARISEMDAFRYISLAFLLGASDLRFISVWNPTFLMLLLSRLMEWSESLVRDLSQGTLTPPGDTPSGIPDQLRAQFTPVPRRAREIEAALGRDSAQCFSALWPQLSVISCWTAAAAAGPAGQLQQLFPGVRLAPKGLLATEGLVSFPLAKRHGNALAVRSHFFEFLPLDGGAIRTAWQVERGRTYQVVLTTGGGLYRYQLGDIVRIDDFVGTCPLIEFLGRHGRVSDLCGEKLHEGHVTATIRAAAERFRLPLGFALLAPEVGDGSAGYTLFFTCDTADDEQRWKQFAREVERGLHENTHYDYCRRLGQLAPMRYLPLTLSTTQAFAIYDEVMLSRGLRAGDIKPANLDTSDDWRMVFM
jgi:hypothetical protein